MSRKKKNKNKKKSKIVLLFLLLDIILIISFLVFRDATSLNNYRKEMEELKKLDVSVDNYDRKIKSSGKYAVVEKAIKGYLNDYSTELDSVLSILNDPKLMKVLSYDNYTKDGPEFKESIKYLNDTKTSYNEKIDKLIKTMSLDNIKDYAYEVTDSPYYISLYNEFMLDPVMLDKFNQNKEILNNSKIKVNNIIDTSMNVLNFLITYKDSWVIENGGIKFQTEELYNYYNELISKVRLV